MSAITLYVSGFMTYTMAENAAERLDGVVVQSEKLETFEQERPAVLTIEEAEDLISHEEEFTLQKLADVLESS